MGSLGRYTQFLIKLTLFVRKNLAEAKLFILSPANLQTAKFTIGYLTGQECGLCGFKLEGKNPLVNNLEHIASLISTRVATSANSKLLTPVAEPEEKKIPEST